MYDIDNYREQSSLERELALENRAYPQRNIIYTSTSQERKRLKWEMRAEALSRLEQAARTTADFSNVIDWWD